MRNVISEDDFVKMMKVEKVENSTEFWYVANVKVDGIQFSASSKKYVNSQYDDDEIPFIDTFEFEQLLKNLVSQVNHRKN